MGFGLIAATLGIGSLRLSQTPILTYHDMIERRDSKALWFDCTVQEFEQQLTWLKSRGANFVTILDLRRHLAGGAALPKNSIAITFADGYEGFYIRALPILRKRHIPVAMFVHTDYVGDRHGRPKMTWVQLTELDKEGLVTICSETRTHPADLRNLADDALSEEMAGSKRILEKRLGHPVQFLAYPNGKFDSRVASAAQTAGYAMAFTEQLKPSEQFDSLFMVPRYVHTKYRQAWNDAHRN